MAFNLLNLLKSVLSTEASSTTNHISKKMPFNPNIAYSLEREAIVDETIHPYRSGRVRFRGSWWNARCEQAITINPEEIVYVIGMTGITLLVKPAISIKMRQKTELKIEP